MIFGREPIAWLNLIKAALVLGVVFGVPVSDSQQNAIMVFVSMILIFLVGGVIQRQLVTPTASPNLPVGTEVNGGAAVVTRAV